MNIHVTWFAAVGGLLMLNSAAAHDIDDDDDYAFRAHLSGAQEVTPPDAPATPSLGVATNTSAQARVEFSRNLSTFRFRLNVRNGRRVTQAHLHCGRPGQNGPVVVFLAALNPDGADVNGAFAQGTRSNEHIEVSAEGCETLIGRPIRNIASLAGAARDGLIYANVHTIDNPAGEVRGQLVREDDDDDHDDDGRDDDDER
jgi:hypothetical protein